MDFSLPTTDGQLIAVASTEGRIDVWRISDGQSQWSRTLSGAAKSIQFSPDSRRLVVLDDNGDKRQFEAGNGRPVNLP
jgi:WD40 repeat protein